MSDLYKKHFLKLLDFTPAQFTSLLTLAAQLKADKKKWQGSTKAYWQKHRAHLRKRLDPYTLLFRSCRI